LRISDYEKEIIVKTVKDIFGNNTKVYLFGSRVYDDKKRWRYRFIHNSGK